jgi:cellulose biosynthesis protein BcsQ
MALNIGFALAQQGAEILLVDMDGQASLTATLPPPPERPKEPKNTPPEHKRFIAGFFSGQTKNLALIVQPTRFNHVWALPANKDLHRMDSGGSANPERELGFVQALHSSGLVVPPSAKENSIFDWIIIDTPPAQSFYTRAALAAADFVNIPTAVEAFATLGIRRLLDNATAMRGLMGRGVKLLGYTMSRWKTVQAAQKDNWSELQTEFLASNVPYIDIVIPYDDKIDVAHLSNIKGGNKGLFGIGTKLTPAAEAYIKLVAQIKERTNG